jgi:predicted membrane-bound spermidine synthase
MALEFTTLNWVAVIAATVVGMVVGVIWYMPQLFGRMWADSVGRAPTTMGNMTPTQYAGALILPLVMAYVLTLFIAGLGANTLVNGAIVGFLAALGFSFMAGLNAFVWDGRPTNWLLVTGGYQFVTLTVMGALIGYLGA